MSNENQKQPTRVVTGKVRLSYVNVFKPKAITAGQEPKYSVSVIIPKTDKKTLDAIEKAIKIAIEEGKDKLSVKGKMPANIKTPLRDGDTERQGDPAYENAFFINANNKNRPTVVGLDMEEIVDPLELKSGDYGRVAITFFAFNAEGNRGIGASLGNIQKVKEGDPLGSFVSAADDFGDDFKDDEDDDI